MMGSPCIKGWGILLLLLGSLGLQAQSLRFESLSLEQGLSNSGVRDVHQDKFGFLWIATEHGLNRYDGYDMKVYRYDPEDSFSVHANYINRLYESPQGELWVQFGAGGLSRYDRARDRFHYYSYDYDEPVNPNNFVQVLTFSKDGKPWIGTNSGLNRIDEEKSCFVKVFPTEADAPPFPIRGLREDGQGNLWLLGSKGLYCLKKGMEVPEWIPPIKEDADKIRSRFLFYTFEDKQDRLWIATRRQGIWQLNESQDSLRQVDMPGVYGTNQITNVFNDQQGGFWASSREHGLFYLAPGADTFERHAHGAGFPEWQRFAFPDSLGHIWIMGPSDTLHRYHPITGSKAIAPLDREGKAFSGDLRPTSATCSPRGLVWIGTVGNGVYKLNPNQPHFPLFQIQGDAMQSQEILSLYEDTQQVLWVGTTMGLRQFDPHRLDFPLFPGVGLDHQFIRAITEDKEGNLWIGGPFGIKILDKDRKLKQVMLPNQIMKDYYGEFWIRKILQGPHGEMWVGTGQGLFLQMPGQKRFTGFYHDPEDPHSLAGNDISDLHFDASGTLWVGNTVAGMNKVTFDPNNRSIRAERFGFNSHQKADHRMTVNVLFENSQGELLIGSYSRGLLKVNKEDLVMDRVTSKERPLIPNIAGILEDGEGNLWISSNDGIFKFRPESKELKRFDQEDGLQSIEFNDMAFAKGKDGRLYFGGIKGMNAFYPEEISEDADVPAPVLTTFKRLGEIRYFNRPLAEMPHIELEHGDRYFSIEFVSLGFNPTDRTQYAYQMMGFDPDWIYAGSQRQASYTHLPPGTYTFRVKAGNQDGQWSDATASIELTLRPPFWKSSWFIACMTILIILGAMLAHHLRLRSRMAKIREIQAIRQKAAADFHDELGHKLTRISLLTEVMRRKQDHPEDELQQYFHKIKANADELYHAMRDFLWALDPRKDSVYELAILLKDFGDELFDNSQMDFRVSGLEETLKQPRLNMDGKRHLALIFKEAMHNTLKYAKGSNVWLRFSLDDQNLRIELEDDGNGFEHQPTHKQGYGLRNMLNRAKAIGGSLEIISQPGKGTQVVFAGLI